VKPRRVLPQAGFAREAIKRLPRKVQITGSWCRWARINRTRCVLIGRQIEQNPFWVARRQSGDDWGRVSGRLPQVRNRPLGAIIE